MADAAEVRAAVEHLVTSFDDVDAATRAKIPDSTVSAVIKDLGLAFRGRFDAGELVDVEEVAVPDAHGASLRLTLSSDDLLALLDGRLSFATGWTHGRIKVDAGFRDLLKLRSFL